MCKTAIKYFQDDGGGDRRSGRAHEGCQHQLFSREEVKKAMQNINVQ